MHIIFINEIEYTGMLCCISLSCSAVGGLPWLGEGEQRSIFRNGIHFS